MNSQSAEPSFLLDVGLKLIMFGGKGGVGKTTCATAAAFQLASRFPDSSILLVSVDPAHSVADCIAESPLPSNLCVREFDASKYLQTFKDKHNRALREIAARGTFLDDTDITQLLDLSLPGMDELTAMLEISRWVTAREYDCIVVDTAPAGHTMRLLAMPELIGRWLDMLDALLAKSRYMRFALGGSNQPDWLDEFVDELTESVENLDMLMRDNHHCRFVPVMLAEALSTSETLVLLAELERLEVPVFDAVVNKLNPKNACPTCANVCALQARELRGLPAHLGGHALWGLPLYSVEVRGLEALSAFWRGAARIGEAPPADLGPSTGLRAGPVENQPPRVDMSPELPTNGTELLLFAGKGGVGKTTLACATALRLAKHGGKEVLLFSTDPAHSLSACLDVRVGPAPRRIRPGLTAMEIDADAEFDSLRKQFGRELDRFFKALLSPNFDLVYDRQVMEKLLDLAPPGLDEAMALTRVMGFLGESEYDMFILDSAPTGHLIRLLELPELVDQWLKVFFGLFLKYKQVFHLPEISRRLVEMSKNLKRLRSLLADPGRSALYAVAIPTEMSFLETKDLVAACKRMGVAAPMLFLNMATSDNGCSFCSTRHRHEQPIRTRFQQSFPEMRQTVVYRRGEPRGVERLEQLGGALYLRAPLTASSCHAERSEASPTQEVESTCKEILRFAQNNMESILR